MSRSPSYSRTKGHTEERKIAKELRDIGYDGVVTSRSESKSMDDKKIDLIDTNNKLPCYIQIKSSQNTPSYHNIENECPLKDKPFVVFWNKQVKKDKNICSAGEVIMLPKDFFYKLLKLYLTNDN